jgi:hypothetical protein
MGEAIEVWINGRAVHARVTRIHSPASRTGVGVVHEIYADEVS